MIGRSPLVGKYDHPVDRDSAHELLERRTQQTVAKAEADLPARNGRASNRQSVGEAFTKSVARSIGSSLGRQILRGVLGAIFKGR